MFSHAEQFGQFWYLESIMRNLTVPYYWLESLSRVHRVKADVVYVLIYSVEQGLIPTSCFTALIHACDSIRN